MTIDKVVFRRTLGSFASGVAVMTTVADGVAHGMTANAFCSVSLDPPLALICLDKNAYMHHLVEQSGIFAINMLADGQEELLRFFSSRTRARGDHEFDDLPHHSEVTGCPVLDRCLAFVDCTVTAMYDAGDHTICVGRIEALAFDETLQPLLYFRGTVRELAPLPVETTE